MMKLRRIALLAALLCVLVAEPAHADPVSLIVSAVSWVVASVSAITWAGVGTFLLRTAAAVGLSYLSKALGGGAKQPDPVGVKANLQAGEDLPQSFIVGKTATAGSLVYHGAWGKSGKTPNAHYTQVIALSWLPLASLERIFVNGELCTYNTALTPTACGYPIIEYRKDGKDHLWVKFYDGTQVAADSWLVSMFGSDPNHPYGSDRIGTGIAYAIATALAADDIFSGFPKYLFELKGIKFYDWRKDSTAGGNGSHRWATPSTWEWSECPIVIKYNIWRGIRYNGVWFYGLQNVGAHQLPVATWTAAANECDAQVDQPGGGQASQYRCGVEIPVDVAPADLSENHLLKACNGRVAEIGGVYKVRVGTMGAAVYYFSDADVIVTDSNTESPHPSLDSIANGIAATYPNPAEAYATKDAPPLYDATLEAADGGRRKPVSVDYPSVPYPAQVQCLMKSALAEQRQWRAHAMGMPHYAIFYEPLDIVAYTSNERGYDDKLFDLATVRILPSMRAGWEIKEIDPADYNWAPDTDYTATTNSPIVTVRPAAQDIVSWSVEGVTVPGDGGKSKAGIRLSWSTADITGVDGVLFEVRLTSSSAVICVGSTEHFDLGYCDITANLSPNTAYQARGKYRPTSIRIENWSSWVDVTTPSDSTTDAITAIEAADAAAALLQAEADEFIAAAAAVLAQVSDSLAAAIQNSAISATKTTERISARLDTKTLRLSASIEETTLVAATETAAVASRATIIEAALTDYLGSGSVASAISSASTAYVSTTNALASRADDLEALVGDNSSNAVWKLGATATSSGASATFSALLSATDGTYTEEAGLGVDVVVSGGSSYSRAFIFADYFDILANQFRIKDSSGNTYASFNAADGSLNIDRINAGAIITAKLADNAATKISSGFADAFYAGGINETTASLVSLTVTGGTCAPIIPTGINGVDVYGSVDVGITSRKLVLVIGQYRGKSSDTTFFRVHIDSGNVAADGPWTNRGESKYRISAVFAEGAAETFVCIADIPKTERWFRVTLASTVKDVEIISCAVVDLLSYK